MSITKLRLFLCTLGMAKTIGYFMESNLPPSVQENHSTCRMQCWRIFLNEQKTYKCNFNVLQVTNIKLTFMVRNIQEITAYLVLARFTSIFRLSIARLLDKMKAQSINYVVEFQFFSTVFQIFKYFITRSK